MTPDYNRFQEFVNNILSKIETPHLRAQSQKKIQPLHISNKNLKQSVQAGQEKDFVTKPFGEKTWY